jgi:fido (protein-threonine AMPylation protein)
LTGVVGVWRDKAEELRSRQSYKDFLVRLRRQWAIETGVLERLYTLSDGATRTLIEQGLDAALISHSDTDISPRQVIALIRDHHSVIEGLYAFVSGQRKLSVSYVRELHQALTNSQDTYEARDTLGRAVQVEMKRGEWKKLPNNVELEDGTLFEFCPPEHVDSEMDRLIALDADHEERGESPDVRAAWLHHRFTLIHPFADGNGRVARALATLLLLRAEWFPLVVTRDDKVRYLSALRTADAGDLASLVQFFGELQRKAVREALSLTEEIERETNAYRAILSSVGQRIAGRKLALAQQYRKAVTTADALHVATRHRLDAIAVEVTAVVRADDPKYSARVTASTRDEPKAEYNRFQIVEAAKAVGYFANTRIHPSWVELVIDGGASIRILVAFHGIGHDWIGLLGAVAVAYRKEPTEDGRTQVTELLPLCREPFEIAYTEDPIATEQRYRQWLENAVVLGLDFWQRFV